jgi:hypothetical protein
MSRLIISVCLVLFLVSTGYGNMVILPDPGWAVGPIGFGTLGQVNLNPADFMANTKISVDVTSLSADWPGDTGFQFGFALNSDLTGWQEKADCTPWWNSADGDRTIMATFDYGAFKAGSSCTWAQATFIENSYSTDDLNSQCTLYLSNLRLTPEPATMALMGLGGLALIRRKK